MRLLIGVSPGTRSSCTTTRHRRAGPANRTHGRPSTSARSGGPSRRPVELRDVRFLEVDHLPARRELVADGMARALAIVLALHGLAHDVGAEAGGQVREAEHV